MIVIVRYIGANVVELTYGRKIERRDDPIFTLTSGLSDALSSGLAVEKAGLLMAFPIRACRSILVKCRTSEPINSRVPSVMVSWCRFQRFGTLLSRYHWEAGYSDRRS